MNRIFLVLASLSTLLLVAAFVLGWSIHDAAARTAAAQNEVRYHLLTGMGALLFVALVHAIVLAYFVGTGRWLEETSNAYGLPVEWRQESVALKFRTLSLIAGCMLLLLVNGALGAIADPATPAGRDGWWGIPVASFHFFSAAATVCVNLLAFYYEYIAVYRNGQIIDTVVEEVRRIRREKGLPV